MPRRRARYSRKPRRMAWESSVFDPATVAPSAQVTAALLPQPPANTVETLSAQGISIVRIIGSLRVNSTHATLSAEWAAGITLVNSDGFGVNAVPDPVADTQQKWMWWMARVSPPPGAGGTSIQLALDIKARRKYLPNNVLAFIIENHDATESIEFALSVRVLVQLP